jgi:hypothetical protein
MVVSIVCKRQLPLRTKPEPIIICLNVLFFNLIVTVFVAILAGTNILFGRHLSKSSARAPIGKS